MSYGEPIALRGQIELEQVALLCATLREKTARGKSPRGAGEGSETQRVDSHHIEHRTAPPSERVLSCRASVERKPDGTPVRLVGTVQDVTELRQAEQRMGRATQRYLDLVSIAPVGVAVFNRTGQLVDANGALCTLLGIPGEKLRGVSARGLSVDPTGSGELAFLRTVRDLRRIHSHLASFAYPILHRPRARGRRATRGGVLEAGAVNPPAVSLPIELPKSTGLEEDDLG